MAFTYYIVLVVILSIQTNPSGVILNENKSVIFYFEPLINFEILKEVYVLLIEVLVLVISTIESSL